MQQRYYDPIAGRFLSVDPVVTDANTGKMFGRYTYVDNNPYLKIDPDGRDPEFNTWADPKGMTHAEMRAYQNEAFGPVLGTTAVIMAAPISVEVYGGLRTAQAVVGIVKALNKLEKVEETVPPQVPRPSISVPKSPEAPNIPPPDSLRQSPSEIEKALARLREMLRPSMKTQEPPKPPPPPKTEPPKLPQNNP